MKKKSLVLKNACVVTCNDNREILEHCDILIDDCIIKKIERNLSATEEIDCTDCVVLPMLSNMHIHLGETIFRGRCDGKDLFEYLDVSHGMYENGIWKEKKEYIHNIVSYITLMEALKNGTGRIATIRSWQECFESGIDAICGYPIINISKLKELYNGFNMGSLKGIAQNYPNIQEAIFIQSLYTIEENRLKDVAKYISENPDTPLFIHICETQWELEYIKKKYGCSPIELLDRKGLFSTVTFCIHSVFLNDCDIDILTKHNACVVLCPISNYKLLNETAPIEKLFQRGIKMCVGTDGLGTNNSASILETLKMTAIVARSPQIDVYDYLDFATKNPCEVLGTISYTGTIEVGKYADLTILKTDKIHLCSHDIVVSNLIYDPSAFSCRYVVNKGDIIYDNLNGSRYLDEKDLAEKYLVLYEQLFMGEWYDNNKA